MIPDGLTIASKWSWVRGRNGLVSAMLGAWQLPETAAVSRGAKQASAQP